MAKYRPPHRRTTILTFTSLPELWYKLCIWRPFPGRHNNFRAMILSRVRFLAVLAFFIVLAAFLYGSYLFLRDVDIKMPALFRPAPGKRLFISMNGFRLIQSEEGRVSLRMNASSADLFEDKEAELKDIELVFTGDDRRTAALIGEIGVMDMASGNGSIRRGAREVRIVTSDGYLMTTNSLFWKAKERVIRTEEPFKVLGREIYLEGKGFSADVDMRKMLVNSNVKAVLQE
jgi:lipopolysaccharide export system protein LptC